MNEVFLGLFTLALIFWVSVWMLMKLSDRLWGRIFRLIRRVKQEVEMAIFTYKFERKDFAKRNINAADTTSRSASGDQESQQAGDR